MQAGDSGEGLRVPRNSKRRAWHFHSVTGSATSKGRLGRTSHELSVPLMQSRRVLSIKASQCTTYAGTLAAETDVIRRPFFTGLAQVIDSSRVNARAWGCDGARKCGEPMSCERWAFRHHSYPSCSQPAAPFPRLLGACAFSGLSENIRLH
jgi:hypothetical protein